MFRRVEAGFPIENEQLKERVINELGLYLKDNSQSWIMQSDGSYIQSIPEGEVINVQSLLMEHYSSK